MTLKQKYDLLSLIKKALDSTQSEVARDHLKKADLLLQALPTFDNSEDLDGLYNYDPRITD